MAGFFFFLVTSLRHRMITASYRAGLTTQIRHVWGRQRLTVLAYHRITNHRESGFDLFAPNVSATPDGFAAQMDYVKHHFNVVSVDNVVSWLKGGSPLPANPLLITFDDGYLDNLENAFPVLQQHGFPAVIFLATNYMGRKRPFFWDLIAYCFNHTSRRSVALPLLGLQQWTNDKERTAVMNNWLSMLKTVSNDEKETAVQKLPALLDVTIPDDAFAHVCLTWDQVRMMAKSGIAFGAHTQNHPILTRISLDDVREEILGSKQRIEAETGQKVTSLAYPNGQATDYNVAIKEIVAESGIEVAFTLAHGPAKPAEVRQDPLTIRRVFVGNRDDMPRFAAKVMGLARLIGIPG